MSTDARISKSRKLVVVVAALLGAGNAGCERPIDSASAPSAPSAELWRFIRCRLNPGARPLYQSELGAHRTGNAGDGNPAGYFVSAGRRGLQGGRSLYAAAQRLFEKRFTILRDDLDNSDALFSRALRPNSSGFHNVR